MQSDMTTTKTHKPRPASVNWYTVRRGGRWRDACVACDRTVVWTAEGWRHVR